MEAASVMPSAPAAMMSSPITMDFWYPTRSISLADGMDAKK